MTLNSIQNIVCKFGRTGSHGSRNLTLVGILNLFLVTTVSAAFYAPSQPVATSLCPNALTLSWVDPNPSTSDELNVLVQRSTRSLTKGFSTIATLPAYTTSYADVSVGASQKYYYRIVTV